MRRIPALRSFAALAVSVLVGSACGTLADTTAATVAGRSVSIESVEQLTRDEGFIGAGTTDPAGGRLPGALFRNVLQFELQRVAWIAEAERWGLELSEQALDDAGAEVDAQMAAGGTTYEPATRSAIAEYVAAQALLEERFAALDPGDDGDLRRLYDGVPSLWERVCVAAVQVPSGELDRVQQELDDGATIEELPERVEGVGLAADPAQQCIPLTQLPESLSDGFDTAPIGENAGPVSVDDGAGGESTYVFRVDDRRTIGFDEAREELAGIAESLSQQGARPWIALIVSTAEIDPRFGSGVAVGPDGQPAIQAPPVPLARPDGVPELFGGQTDPVP
jgi:hypothetical protein